jgi:hypothetical protein
MHQPPLPRRKYFWYSFLLEAESIPGPQCGRKVYVNEKFQWHLQEPNPWPSGFSAVPQTNRTTVCPDDVCIRNFSLERCKRRCEVEGLNGDGRIVLKFVLNKWGVRIRTSWYGSEYGPVAGQCCMVMKHWFLKKNKCLWLPVRLLSSQEVCCYVVPCMYVCMW